MRQARLLAWQRRYISSTPSLLSSSSSSAMAMASLMVARPFVPCDAACRSPSLSLCSRTVLTRLRGRSNFDRIGSRFCALAASPDEPPGVYADEHQVAGNQSLDSTKSTSTSFWKNWQMNPGELKEKVAKLGRAGLLAYGLFNAITYTTFFFIAFLAFEKTGQNPANNLKACLGGMVSMWTGNNFTRPLRVAGAAALAPFMNKVLKKTQKLFNLADEASTFLFLVIALFVFCGAAVGLLILSRLGR